MRTINNIAVFLVFAWSILAYRFVNFYVYIGVTIVLVLSSIILWVLRNRQAKSTVFYEESVSVKELNKTSLLEYIKKKGWKMESLEENPLRVRIKTQTNLYTFGEYINIEYKNAIMTLKSYPVYRLTKVDYGRNKKNIQEFISFLRGS